ncbi:MAG: alpha/beta fold hydrolase, partial [Micrococcus sp.]|nr:alpha/beta fold hydrolase [Micrococcus sp.]
MSPSTTLPSPAIQDSLTTAAFGAWNTYVTNASEYWAHLVSRQVTPWTVMGDALEWSTAIYRRSKPEWAHEHTIVKEWPLARLRDYSTPDAEATMVPTVILPPQAGHDSSIVDYSLAQSQIVTGRDAGCHRIYSLDWVGATQETKTASIDDYMQLLEETAELLGGRLNLVGDCQGGWLATIFAAVHPDKVNSLAIAGAPIDFHAGDPLMLEWVHALAPTGDLAYFRGVVAAHGGLLPGRFLLDGFKALQPDQEFSRGIQLLNNLHDPVYRERHRVFEDWFQWTQSLSGTFYLWILEHLFVNNSLIAGELEVQGQRVDLSRIECPLFLLAGEADHITPPDQVWALADHASTPAHLVGRHAAASGHLGLFMSREALREHWPVIFEEMAALSTATLEDDPDELTDEPVSAHQRHRWTTTAALMEGGALTGAQATAATRHSTKVKRPARRTSAATSTAKAPATKAAPAKKAAPAQKPAPA